MSKLAPKFVAAAQVRSWQTAYNECNGCPMFAMLDGMEEIGPALLADMRAQMAVYDVWGGPNMPRIRFAMDVVQTGRIPTPPPGLPDDQVAEARTFLAHRKSGGAGGGTPSRRLKIALFWTRAAQHEAVSSGLIQKARDLLKANKNLFHLDVLPDRTILPIDRTQNETDPESCGSGDFVEVQLLAEKSAAYSPDRIPVIFYSSDFVLGPHGELRDPISHGCGYQPWAGKGFAMINSRKVMADNATLLHEVGHGAGLDHRLGVPKNIMSYGTERTEFADDQLRVLGGCFFCSK